MWHWPGLAARLLGTRDAEGDLRSCQSTCWKIGEDGAEERTLGQVDSNALKMLKIMGLVSTV